MHLTLGKYSYFLFDLDDTLYPEKDYLYQGYKAIDKELSSMYHIKKGEISSFLISTFESEGRKQLFDKLFDHFNINKSSLKDVLQVLRNFKPPKKISLYPLFYDLIPQIINSSERVFIVTNGNPIQQKNKVNNIDWKSLDKELVFVFANEFKRKPSKDSFNHIKNKYLIKEDSTIMIGDADTDKEFAENCNIDFIYITDFIKLNSI